MAMEVSNRGRQWLEFSEIVLKHIEEYTVPQYGDEPDDQIEDWTAKECVRAINKRCSRYGSNSRDNQELLDLKKIAHEACLAYFKEAKLE
jgi:hypothetical protein